MKRFLFALFIGVYPVFISAADVHSLSKTDWDVPKRAETILQMTAIKQVFAELASASSGQLLIRYPGGDEGSLWAHELRAWLVSLGIPSGVIELRPGSSHAGVIELSVQDSQSGLPGTGKVSLNK